MQLDEDYLVNEVLYDDRPIKLTAIAKHLAISQWYKRNNSNTTRNISELSYLKREKEVDFMNKEWPEILKLNAVESTPLAGRESSAHATLKAISRDFPSLPFDEDGFITFIDALKKYYYDLPEDKQCRFDHVESDLEDSFVYTRVYEVLNKKNLIIPMTPPYESFSELDAHTQLVIRYSAEEIFFKIYHIFRDAYHEKHYK